MKILIVLIWSELSVAGSLSKDNLNLTVSVVGEL